MAKKNKINDSISNDQKIIFCTECGHFLDDFCFSSKSKDMNYIKKRSAKCMKKGKLKGDFCSCLFIVSPENYDEFWDED